ncbi:histidine phosphatase family protein [Cohnella sp. AR92]|uniref:histidine phosphatase family protein n=1 Tax=Cohnella sp. AR92 TaxID=648716 RepID=UPI000F8CF3E0|nr:histidine phosphatase family protein [Cohnella sp. AR92]RUS46225.1 histidine phosphatase family protein [Cohnella sp. AR92]
MIGLIRHFKVLHKPQRRWMTGPQFTRWVEQYDQGAIRSVPLASSDIEWDVCYCSPLSRATRTAAFLFDGPLIVSDHLREIGIHAVSGARIRMPLTLWLGLARLAWLFSHRSQVEGKKNVRLRAERIIDEIERRYPSSNVLIVSHGAFMRVLDKALHSRGYSGRTDLPPRNGKLYLFRRFPG